MKSNRQSIRISKAPDYSFSVQRTGTTLSEVLISLLVMSVGVVSLATLFPISILRSVQAHQLTSSANLRYNVESMLNIYPQLYSIGTPWQAGYPYNAGDMVTPSELTSLKSPPVVFMAQGTPPGSPAGLSGTTEPNWNFTDGASTNDGTVVWTTFRLQNYVIDPLGTWEVESNYRAFGGSNFFGNDGGTPPMPRATNGYGATGVRVFGGIGVNSANNRLAEDAATLPDSWSNQVESFGVSYTPGATSCTLVDLQVDLTNTTMYDSTGSYMLSRIVFYDSTGKYSEARPISGISGLSGTSQTITWPAASGALNLTPSRVRVDNKDRRFTWMLSVRRGYSGASFMDVVVFHKRPFSGKDEQVFPATFTATTDPGFDAQPGIANYDDDQNGTKDDASELGYLGSDDSPRNWVVVQYNESTTGKPFVKKGGFVTDADNLRWYRIIDIVEGDLIYPSTPTGVMTKAGLNTALSYYTPDALAPGMTNALLLRVENKILQSGPTAGAASAPLGGAIVMRGIVDVYPIRTHLTWEN